MLGESIVRGAKASIAISPVGVGSDPNIVSLRPSV